MQIVFKMHSLRDLKVYPVSKFQNLLIAAKTAYQKENSNISWIVKKAQLQQNLNSYILKRAKQR